MSTGTCANSSVNRTNDSSWEKCLRRPKPVVRVSVFLHWLVLAVIFANAASPLLADQNGPLLPEAHTSNESVPELTSVDVVPAVGSAVSQSRFSRRDVLIASLTIFVLAIFVGFEVITKVPPTLHTPLMSGSNAISGITIVGALIAASSQQGGLAAVLGLFAVILATINVVGGFMVTGRMLSMFQKKKGVTRG